MKSFKLRRAAVASTDSVQASRPTRRPRTANSSAVLAILGPVAGRLARTVEKCSGRFALSPSVNPATCGAMSVRLSYKNATVGSTRQTFEWVGRTRSIRVSAVNGSNYSAWRAGVRLSSPTRTVHLRPCFCVPREEVDLSDGHPRALPARGVVPPPWRAGGGSISSGTDSNMFAWCCASSASGSRTGRTCKRTCFCPRASY